MQLKVIKPFSWAHRNVHVVEYDKGEVIDTDDQDLIEVSLREKWTQKSKGSQPEQAPANEESLQAEESYPPEQQAEQ